MHNIFRVAFFICAVWLLQGCVHMSPAECKQADWHALGVQDGRNGEALDTLDQRRKSCAEAGMGIDQQRYMQGRDEGLQVYCQPRNAVELGLAGKGYNNVCQDPRFRRRWEIAREVYQARNSLDELDRRRGPLEDKLRRAANDDERRNIREQLRELDGRLRGARNRLQDAEDALRGVR